MPSPVTIVRMLPGIASDLTRRAQKWDLALTFIDLSSGGIHPSIFDLPSHSSMEAVADSLLVHSDHSERRAGDAGHLCSKQLPLYDANYYVHRL